MSNYPEMSNSKFRTVFTENEWSKTANAAFDTLDATKKCKNMLDWITGSMIKKSSNAIAERNKYLLDIIKLIRKPGSDYSPALMKHIDSALFYQAVCLDQSNIDFDEYERAASIEQLKYCLDEYANVIVTALTKEMTEEEAEAFALNRPL